jgi:hypothetical protein
MKKFFQTPALFLLLAILGFSFNGISQISILNANINSYNITPASLFQVSLTNTYGDVQVVLEATLLSTDNSLLLKATSAPFLLKKGITTPGMNISIASSQYGSDEMSSHIKTFHTLPSGKYHYCCTVNVLSHDVASDQYCDDVESENTSFMTLIFPSDHDTIETPMPLLCWSHSDPFNQSSGGDYYKMVVVELTPDQSAEAGITANVPVFMKTNLMTHQVQYPYDARGLQKGHRYGWQVQKVSNEVVVNKTEAWDFTIKPDNIEIGVKYGVLKRTLDAGYYVAMDNKVYFRYEEAYTGGDLQFEVFDSNGKQIKPKAKNESKEVANPGLKTLGTNRFCLDVEGYSMKEGFYTMQVRNSKSEKFLLKFYVK